MICTIKYSARVSATTDKRTDISIRTVLYNTYIAPSSEENKMRKQLVLTTSVVVVWTCGLSACAALIVEKIMCLPYEF